MDQSLEVEKMVMDQRAAAAETAQTEPREEEMAFFAEQLQEMENTENDDDSN